LPGYGFSSPLRTPKINAITTADLWRTLMVEVLGYPRFAAHGGDWGALITAQLGHKYADDLVGIHLIGGAPLDWISKPPPGPEDYDDEERAFAELSAKAVAQEAGYFAIQTTKPQTLAFALEDSPIGLAAWLVDKRRAWSDCKGDVEQRFSKDELLTCVSIYWFTRTFGTSARYYYELARNPWAPSHLRTPMVEAPTGFLRMSGDAGRHYPKSALAWNFNMQRFTKAARGGHFAPAEAPDIVISELREFFRPLR
jgi:pimeloyl-ACP methyl ester carboxylesterase